MQLHDIIHVTGELRASERVWHQQTLTEAWMYHGVLHTSRTPEIEEAERLGRVHHVHGYVYPGLVDAHAHPGVGYSAEPISEEEICRRLHVMARQGVTFAREMGSQSVYSSLLGVGVPKVAHAGRHLARFKRYIPNMPIDVEPENLAYAVAEQARISRTHNRRLEKIFPHASLHWVKIVGDWIDRSEREKSDLRPLWPLSALKEAVAAAHENHAKVAVHTFSHEAIDDLLAAGVDCIEHGTGMDAAQLEYAKENNVLIDPTFRQISTFHEIAAPAWKYPIYKRHMLAMHRNRRAHAQLIMDSGVHILMGSDSGENVLTCGLPFEIVEAVRLGMPAARAMKAASYGAREILGLPTWEEGAPADFVIYENDPEKDIYEVFSPAHVFIDGILVNKK